MRETPMSEEKLTEGWGVIRPGDRKCHYYRDGAALCGRIRFYLGPLEKSDAPSKDDCAACVKKRKREAAA